MGNFTQLAGVLMVVCIGLWAGGILVIAVDRTHVWAQMGIRDYAVDFRRSVRRLDPMMPILGAVGGLSAIGFAVTSQDAGVQLFAWLGAGLALLAIVASIVIAEPINSRFRRLPEGTPPPRSEQDRVTWRRFHRVRAVVAVASFAALATALAG